MIEETIDDMRHHVIEDLIHRHIPPNAYAEQWDAAGLRQRLREVVAIDFPVDEWSKEEGIPEEEIRERVIKSVDELYAGKRVKYGPDIMGQVEKAVLLRTLDGLWREHIVTVDQLRQVIHLRGYGQRDPLNEYKSEGFQLFEHMVLARRLRPEGELDDHWMDVTELSAALQRAAQGGSRRRSGARRIHRRFWATSPSP